MIAWLRSLIGSEDPTYIAEMRKLWKLPEDWTIPTSARLRTKVAEGDALREKARQHAKCRSLNDWIKKHGEKRSA